MNSTHEVEAMRLVASALDPLPEDSRVRVITWAASLYGVRVQTGSASLGAARGTVEQIGAQPGQETAIVSFGTFAEFFDATDPQSESEKALVGGCWLQKREGMATFDSAAVNRALKNLGHAVTNITSAFDDLIEQRPSLAVQTAKSGRTKQARKKYMITKAGEKAVEQMLSGNLEQPQ